MDAVLQAWWEWAADLGRVTLLLAAVLGLGALLRRSSAALRHLLDTLGLAFATALPLVAILAPALVLPLLPAAETPVATITVAPAAAAVPGAAWFLVPLLWATGFLLCAARVVYDRRRLRRLEARATRLDGPLWRSVLDTLCEEIGLTRRVTLLQSPDTLTPATWGVVRPVVVLPDDARGWTPGRRRAVLLHELAHVARRDMAVQLLADLFTALLWFHPLAWTLRARMLREREHACDDLVLRRGAKASGYAGLLLSMYRHTIARRVVRNLPSPLPAAASFGEAGPGGRTRMERRLTALLHPRRNRRGTSRRAWGGLTLAMVVVAWPLASTRVVAAAPTPTPSPVVVATPPDVPELIPVEPALPPPPVSAIDHEPTAEPAPIASVATEDPVRIDPPPAPVPDPVPSAEPTVEPEPRKPRRSVVHTRSLVIEIELVANERGLGLHFHSASHRSHRNSQIDP